MRGGPFAVHIWWTPRWTTAIRLHQLVIARYDGLLALRHGAQVWESNADTVRSKIYGPYFEDLARAWCLAHASAGTLGGLPSWVRLTTIACREHRQPHEIDVVAMSSTPGEPDRILAIGEAKAAVKPVDVAELTRLEHLRDLLPSDRVVEPPRLLLFARAGFTTALRRAGATRRDVELVDLERLYRGD